MTAQRTTLAPPPLDAAPATAAVDGVWTRRDACNHFGESHVRAQIAAGRWAAPVPAVIVTHNGPITPQQRIWVALSAAPPGTVLGGLSAAEDDGLKGFAPEGISLVIPGSSYPPINSVMQLPEEWNVQVRWSRMLGIKDVNPNAVPPKTRRPRSVLDAASERVSERRARVIVLAAVQQRFTRPPDLWDALSRRGRCRNRRIIVESIIDATGGIESLPELEFETIRRRLRLPKPARQRVLRRNDGRCYLDNDWPDVGVRVEIHGIPHSEIRNWDSDLLRQNDLSIQGGGLLVFSSYAVRHVQDRVESQLVRMFTSRGYCQFLRQGPRPAPLGRR